jgi:hypothetical protein
VENFNWMKVGLVNPPTGVNSGEAESMLLSIIRYIPFSEEALHSLRENSLMNMIDVKL